MYTLLNFPIDGNNGSFVKWNKDNGIDQYCSVNTINTWNGYTSSRKSENVFELMAFFVDIDVKKDSHHKDKDIEWHIQEVLNRCRSNNIPFPTTINNSGNGLHVYWTIKALNPINEETKKPQFGSHPDLSNAWRKAENALIELFFDLGADPHVKAPSSVLRVVGSTNSKCNRKCKTVYKTDNQILPEEMFNALFDYSYEEVVAYKNQPATKKQQLLAQELGVTITDNKLVAQKQLANFIENNSNKKTCTGSDQFNYIIPFLTNAYKMDLITKGKGIRNSFIYLIGIGLNHLGFKGNLKQVFNRICQAEKLRITNSEQKEYFNTLVSGFKANYYQRCVSYTEIAKKLKITNIEEVKNYKQKRTSPFEINDMIVRVYYSKPLQRLSRNKLSNVFNISKCSAKKIKQVVNFCLRVLQGEEELLDLTNQQILKEIDCKDVQISFVQKLVKVLKNVINSKEAKRKGYIKLSWEESKYSVVEKVEVIIPLTDPNKTNKGSPPN